MKINRIFASELKEKKPQMLIEETIIQLKRKNII